ncbi:MAG: hypothetical protein JST22_06950 [Bacteroidetes bacterium]|nr:hypothetical protein [Bacteroidota bacterium]
MTLFKKKTPSQPAPEVLSLPVLNDPALARKLASEVRTCPTCSYEITNPMNDRCPRCFTTVPLSEHTNCGECSHQGNCTYAGDQKISGI